MITIGEYLARTDIDRPGRPLTQMLLRRQVKEESLPVLPVTYAIVKPMMRSVFPQQIMAKIAAIDPLPKPPGQIFYLDAGDQPPDRGVTVWGLISSVEVIETDMVLKPRSN
jgi:hypothetical protein